MLFSLILKKAGTGIIPFLFEILDNSFSSCVLTPSPFEKKEIAAEIFTLASSLFAFYFYFLNIHFRSVWRKYNGNYVR